MPPPKSRALFDHENLTRVALACVLGAGLYHLYFHAAYTLDDAYISFRYARNLARGAGLTWNPGEYVKGYSNTLYTVLMAVPELFDRDPITLSKLLGYVAFLSIAVAGVRSYEPALRARAVWFLLLCAASTSLAVHCMNGLETGCYAALVFIAVLRRVREQAQNLPPWSALPFAAAVLMRPEGILLFAAAAVHDLIWRMWQRRFQLQDLAFYLAPLLVYALELWLSRRYYGVALPNTYYAKTNGAQGISQTLLSLWHGAQAQLEERSYLRSGMQGTGLGVLGLSLVIPALLDRSYRRRSWALAFIVAAQLVFIVRAGDDWAPAFRFGVPMLAPLFMLIADSVGTLAALARRYQRLVGWSLMIAIVLLLLPRQLQDSHKIDKERYVNAQSKLIQGAFFASLAEAGITLSSFDIGGQGYAAGGFDVLDTAGLTSRDTVGCRHGGRRCTRYAELIMPELVRLHSNRARDAFVSKTVLRHGAYLALDGGKYLLQRALVFPARLPPGLPPSAEGSPLMAADVPIATTAGGELTAALYFDHRSDLSALAQRRLVWQGAHETIDAQASSSVLQHLNSQDTWHDTELFKDRVTLRAPSKPGAYTLSWADEPLAKLEVIAPGAAAAERARALVQDALGAPDLPARLLRLSQISQLDAAEARQAYQRAAVSFGRELRAQAQAEKDPLTALRGLQRAHAWLLRAYWESGHALAELRRELDANGKLRSHLIAQLLDAT